MKHVPPSDIAEMFCFPHGYKNSLFRVPTQCQARFEDDIWTRLAA